MNEEEYACLLKLIGQEIVKFTGFTDIGWKGNLAKRIARMIANDFFGRNATMSDKSKQVALAEIIRDARDNFMMRTELFAVVAAETKAKHDAYVSAGFSPEEALRLCIGPK